MPKKILSHGQAGMYTNHECRCHLCVLAWNAYCAGRKAARRTPGKVLGPEYTHSLEATYQAGCTCPLCKAAHSKYSREQKYFRANPEIYAKLLEEQQGMCGCCGKTPRTALVVDHIHGTTSARGLLCQSCNTGIGKLGDTIEGLERALRYLRGEYRNKGGDDG